MNKIVKICTATAAAVLLSTSAFANGHSSHAMPMASHHGNPYYLGAFVGHVWNSDIEEINTTTRMSRIDLDDEWNWGVLFGKVFTHNMLGDVRGDVEYRFHKPDMDKITSYTSGAVTDVFTNVGDLETHSIFANVYQTINIASWERWFTPYVGVGIGFTDFIAEFENVSSSVNTVFSFLETGVTNRISDTVFSYQVKAGATMQLMNDFSAFLEYRYTGTAEVRILGANGDEVHNSAVNLGFHWYF